MAKIESYVLANAPLSGSDKLIGTDTAHNNATKNFSINELITFITDSGVYVPYTGATANVDLGTNNIIANDITVNDISSNDINCNDILSNNITANNIDIAGLFKVSSSSGTSGQVLSSQGAGLPPIWSTSQGEVLNVKKTMLSSDILTMGTNPFELVAAIPGKAIVPLSIVIDFHFGGTAYISGGGINVSNGQILYIVNATSIITSGFNYSYWVGGITGIGTFSALTTGNPLIVTINGGVDPIVGNGTMDIYVTYTAI